MQERKETIYEFICSLFVIGLDPKRHPIFVKEEEPNQVGLCQPITQARVPVQPKLIQYTLFSLIFEVGLIISNFQSAKPTTFLAFPTSSLLPSLLHMQRDKARLCYSSNFSSGSLHVLNATVALHNKRATVALYPH